MVVPSLKQIGFQINVLLFLIPGIYTLFQQRWAIGLVFLLVALILEVSSFERLRGPVL